MDSVKVVEGRRGCERERICARRNEDLRSIIVGAELVMLGCSDVVVEDVEVFDYLGRYRFGDATRQHT